MRPLSFYGIDAVLQSGEVRIAESLDAQTGDVCDLLGAIDLRAMAYSAQMNNALSHPDFVKMIADAATDEQLIVIYGVPLEDYGVARFRSTVEGEIEFRKANPDWPPKRK